MKQTLIGLAALLVVSTGCPKEDPSINNPKRVEEERTVMIPTDCQKVIDVRYDFYGGAYEVLCENKEKDATTELTIYFKQTLDDRGSWTAIHYHK